MATIKQRALAPGSIVHKRYRIERVLGEGGFGVTYLVTDLQEDKIAAMKEYFPVDIALRNAGTDIVMPLKDNEKSYVRFRERFLEEAQVIYRYKGHPNIIDVFHLFYDNNTAYYVMEYIGGMDLKKQLEHNGGRLPWNVLGPIMSQVASALKEVHRDGMIHCDISPDNIFVLDGGQVKLIDFGAAKSMINTKSSIIMLKRGFAPPEQLSAHGKLGPWTDIYAMAVTIYRAFTGRMPPAAEERLMHDVTMWPSDLGLQVPSAKWEQALKKAMALRIDERYQDAEEFWVDLAGTQVIVSHSPVLEGVRGYYAGQRIPVHGEVMLGRDPGKCQILYPPNAKGVSGKHMMLWSEGQRLYAMDVGSSCGTWLGKERMLPGLCYDLFPADMLYFGDGQIFRVGEPE